VIRRFTLLSLALVWAPLANCSPVEGPVKPTADVPEAEGWRAEVVVDELEHPWSIAWLPDGSALITERPGRLRLFRDGALVSKPVGGLPRILSHGQGGLLDVALHPDFEENQLVYLTFATGTPKENRTALARGRLDGERLRDVEVIFQNADTKQGGQHFGSRLAWLPDKSLLMSIGDGGNPPTSFRGQNIRNQAQRLETHFGKMLRLTEGGRPHPDNPFVGREGARPEIHSYGHRNIQGLTLDPSSGRVWATEHGSRGGDELNLIEPGKNYGWPEVTYSLEYSGPRVSEETSRPGVQDPLINWTPSKAPSGLAFYTGDRYPDWKGNLFSGALVFGQVRRIVLDGARVVDEQKLTIGNRVRDVRQGPDGYLYVLIDSGEGSLLRILPD
jgi:aldose sugar dehydrogenase